MSQPTDEPEGPDLAQIVEQLDRIEATLNGVAAAMVANADEPVT
jgi:hypothetical protein